MKHMSLHRRDFLKTSLLGGLALGLPWGGRRLLAAAEPSAAPAAAAASLSRVAVTAGEDRADLTFQALKQFSGPIAAAIGDKRVIIKPNNVSTVTPLCATDAKNLEGILEFLHSIGKDKNVVIAESPAGGPASTGFDNYGYTPLAAKYGAKLFDLDQDEYETFNCISEKDFRPHLVRAAKTMLDPNNYIISAAKFKTHDTVVATLSLKNVVVGSALKRGGNDKPVIHGGGFRGLNYNILTFAARPHPHLAVIDGYEGMEGNGPIHGSAVNSRVCVVSPDWLAADRVAVELMGIDFAKIGYLNYCARAGMGEADLAKIEILGPALKDHIKTYKLANNIDQQLIWMQPMKNG